MKTSAHYFLLSGVLSMSTQIWGKNLIKEPNLSFPERFVFKTSPQKQGWNSSFFFVLSAGTFNLILSLPQTYDFRFCVSVN